MSTTYFELRHPVTSVRIKSQNSTHTVLSIWTNSKMAGSLTLETRELAEFLLLLKSSRELVYVSGVEKGKVNIEAIGVDLNRPLISESGDLTNLFEIRKKYPT